MIHVTAIEDGRGRLSSLIAKGHAEFAVQSEDVVCAAASAILQAAYAGLQDVAKIVFEGRRLAGDLEIRIPQDVREREDVAAILKTAVNALEAIARQYPEYLRVTRGVES